MGNGKDGARNVSRDDHTGLQAVGEFQPAPLLSVYNLNVTGCCVECPGGDKQEREEVHRVVTGSGDLAGEGR